MYSSSCSSKAENYDIPSDIDELHNEGNITYNGC